jgi:beta-phosphoglucomutase-like phosphatase (HAD superfamily)
VAVRALIFDFDGLLVDTEVPALRAWQQVLSGYGVSLPLPVWHACVGTRSSRATALAVLADHIGQFDPEPVLARWWEAHLALVAAQSLCAGVGEYLTAAAERGLRLAVASSATGDWVATQLRRVGVYERFHVVSTGDGRPAKPAPDVYLAALDALGVPAGEAVAFEDSPIGVAAAKAAGLYCVAVPNEVTAGLAFPGADLLVPSLTALPLHDLLAGAGHGK